MKAVIAGTVSSSPHDSAWHRKAVQPRPGAGHILRRNPSRAQPGRAREHTPSAPKSRYAGLTLASVTCSPCNSRRSRLRARCSCDLEHPSEQPRRSAISWCSYPKTSCSK